MSTWALTIHRKIFLLNSPVKAGPLRILGRICSSQRAQTSEHRRPEEISTRWDAWNRKSMAPKLPHDYIMRTAVQRKRHACFASFFWWTKEVPRQSGKGFEALGISVLNCDVRTNLALLCDFRWHKMLQTCSIMQQRCSRTPTNAEECCQIDPFSSQDQTLSHLLYVST